MILESRDNQMRVLQKAKEEPPPYTSIPSGSAHLPPPRDISSSSHKPLPRPSPRQSPRPSINQVHIQERGDNISGTFFIDPSIPSLGFNAKGDKARKKNPPHASFRTRHGGIALDLGTTGEASVAGPKANVLVSSRSGNISIKLLPNAPSRPRIGLEAISRGGNIMLFVPETFAGVIQLNTRKGNLQFLPALASRLKVLKESDKEALILVGDQKATETREMDFCQLNTRHGKIIVGLSDIDKPDVKLGFWKKLASVFGGE
ncbi:hypothetical protein LshimejAT787_1303010 [Lyophyllum shimeji]|uniref:DUF7330 domain-containing protein n=1 Tax=Lyophyllum shimeji TaxID=47721 RepID=A0A9P3PWQ1_LYOSH|nr:hypothetical protein LshimejAT787_1303010 [Lyophyllum shimeji]